MISVLKPRASVGRYHHGKSATYYHFLLAAVICLLEESGVEIIEVKFSLNCELVICVEDVERECGLWSLEQCGVPAYVQELAIVLDPFCCPCTGTELYIDVMNPIDVNYDDGLSVRA